MPFTKFVPFPKFHRISKIPKLTSVLVRSEQLLFLPLAPEGWGKVIFSVCVSVLTWGGGTPMRSSWGESCYPHPSEPRGTPSFPIGGRGYPTLGLDGGTPHPTRRESSRASTCYAGGGMPLAFTQNFLVGLILFQTLFVFILSSHSLSFNSTWLKQSHS